MLGRTVDRRSGPKQGGRKATAPRDTESANESMRNPAKPDRIVRKLLKFRAASWILFDLRVKFSFWETGKICGLKKIPYTQIKEQPRESVGQSAV